MGLNTIEKFLVLAKHPTRARFIISHIHLKYGITGAMLLELSSKKIVDVQNNHLKIIPNFELQDNEYPELENLSERIARYRKTKKIKSWIKRLSWKYRRYKWVFINGLAKKRYFKIEQKHFLGIPYKNVYLINSTARNKLIFQLRDQVLYKKKKSDDDLAILGLVEACKMYKIISSNRRETKTIKRELKKILKEEPITQVVDNTIKQIRAAITVAIATSVAASSAGR